MDFIIFFIIKDKWRIILKKVQEERKEEILKGKKNHWKVKKWPGQVRNAKFLVTLSLGAQRHMGAAKLSSV